MIVRLALRNLLRNPRRTVALILTVAVCALDRGAAWALGGARDLLDQR